MRARISPATPRGTGARRPRPPRSCRRVSAGRRRRPTARLRRADAISTSAVRNRSRVLREAGPLSIYAVDRGPAGKQRPRGAPPRARAPTRRRLACQRTSLDRRRASIRLAKSTPPKRDFQGPHVWAQCACAHQGAHAESPQHRGLQDRQNPVAKALNAKQPVSPSVRRGARARPRLPPARRRRPPPPQPPFGARRGVVGACGAALPHGGGGGGCPRAARRAAPRAGCSTRRYSGPLGADFDVILPTLLTCETIVLVDQIRVEDVLVYSLDRPWPRPRHEDPRSLLLRGRALRGPLPLPVLGLPVLGLPVLGLLALPPTSAKSAATATRPDARRRTSRRSRVRDDGPRARRSSTRRR